MTKEFPRTPDGAVKLVPRALDDLPNAPTARALLDAPDMAVFTLPHAPARRNLDRHSQLQGPYITVLRDAVFYRTVPMAPDASDGGPLPEGLTWGDQNLLVGGDGTLIPDSFSKSKVVPRALVPGVGSAFWSAPTLPEPQDELKGTYLFGELFYAHFGHALVDMPSRLWPLNNGLLDIRDIDGVIGRGMLGAGLKGERCPEFARTLLSALGVPREKTIFLAAPTRVERLIIPSRVAPYTGTMHPVFSRAMRVAGRELESRAPDRSYPRKLWLSRSRVSKDQRTGPLIHALDELFAAHGFAVVHPQELDFAEQVALARHATHIAGPVGSQLHLCVFSEQPGLKVLNIAPSFFKLPINGNLIRDIGGVEAHFLIDLPKPKGVRHKAFWDASPEDRDRLADTLARWLAVS